MQKSLAILFFFSLLGKNLAQKGFSAGADKVITCLEKEVVLDGTLPTKDYTFFWSSKKGFSSKLLKPSVSVADMYYLEASFGAIYLKDSVLVTENKNIPKANAGADQVLNCLFPEIILNIKDPGKSFGTFITGPNNFISNTLPVKTKTTGTYVVEIFKGYCSSFDTVLVSENKTIKKPDAGTPILISCKKPAAKLQAIFPGKEIAFEWFFDGKKISETLQPFVNQVGIYTFKIKQGNCENSDTVSVVGDFRKPKLSGVTNYTLPCNAPHCVTSELKCEYPKEATFSNLTFCEKGTFTLKSKIAANGCEDAIKINVTQNDSMRFSTQTTAACAQLANGSISIDKIWNAALPYTFSLDNTDFQKDTHFKNIKAGKYIVTLKDSKGCESKLKVEVPNRNAFVINLPSEFTFCSHDKPLEIDATVKDTTLGEIFYTWNDGSNTPTKKFVKSENIWIEARNECSSDKKFISIKDDFDEIRTVKIYVPNVFNPNSKTLENQGFKTFFKFKTSDYQLTIYDKFGVMLFRTDNPDFVWDGTFLGKNVLSNIYTWQVSALIDVCGNPLPFYDSGTVMLIRD
jgi:gliding motility-associated-like protein